MDAGKEGTYCEGGSFPCERVMRWLCLRVHVVGKIINFRKVGARGETVDPPVICYMAHN